MGSQHSTPVDGGDMGHAPLTASQKVQNLYASFEANDALAKEEELQNQKARL